MCLFEPSATLDFELNFAWFQIGTSGGIVIEIKAIPSSFANYWVLEGFKLRAGGALAALQKGACILAKVDSGFHKSIAA